MSNDNKKFIKHIDPSGWTVYESGPGQQTEYPFAVGPKGEILRSVVRGSGLTVELGIGVEDTDADVNAIVNCTIPATIVKQMKYLRSLTF